MPELQRTTMNPPGVSPPQGPYSHVARVKAQVNRKRSVSLAQIKHRVEAKFQIGVDKSSVVRVLQGGLYIYKLKDGEEGHVYTSTPGHSTVNPEDGQIFEIPAVWMRWAAADSNGI